MGDVTLSKGPRWSFNLGGSGFATRRRSRQLIGVTGATARGDVAYRFNRSNAIGVDYGFTHFSFTNSFGSSDVQRLGINYAVQLGRRWHFGLRVGAARVETQGLRRTAVDPIVAAIIGQTVGVETFQRRNIVPHGDVRLSRSFGHSSVSFGYSRGVTPGNGIYLTSQRESARANYSYTATRKLNLGLSGGYTSFSSLSEEIGKLQSYYGTVGVSYKLTGMVHSVVNLNARKIDVRQNPFQRVHYRASVGFAFSPGDLPLSLW
jgi:hypothetical protein